MKMLRTALLTLLFTGTLLSACQPAAVETEENSLESKAELRAANLLVAMERAKGALVLQNGTVITATGADPIPNGAVVVENGFITAVGPVDEINIPASATIIDVQGRTILPGLIDARTSLLKRLEIIDGEFEQMGLQMYLTNPVRAGVTTVRDTNSHWGNTQDLAALRTTLAAYGNRVPTVVLTGPTIGHSDGSALTSYADGSYGVSTAEQASQITARFIGAGVDQIALIQSITQEAGTRNRDALPPTLNADQLQAIVQAAHGQNMWVMGQAVFPDEAELLLASGVDELGNWPSRSEPIPESLIQALVDRSVPVVSGFNIVRPQDGDVRRFLDAGGTLVFGTYGPNSGPLSTPYREFRLMLGAGMSPMEMILSATANAAHAVGLGNLVGTLEAGKLADIIVVDGDPLEDMQAIRDVVYVVKGGELVVSKVGQ